MNNPEPTKQDRIAELWAEGLTAREIGERLDITEGNVGSTINDMRRAGRDDVPRRYPKQENVSPITGRSRAARLYPELGVCEHDGCGRPAVDRHHIDTDTTNNERTNLSFLCRLHHLEVDGRLDLMRTDWCRRPRNAA